jgi:hypothetical protein
MGLISPPGVNGYWIYTRKLMKRHIATFVRIRRYYRPSVRNIRQRGTSEPK